MIFMEIGDYINSSLYVEKGKGRIINIEVIGGITTFEVYFPKTNEILSLNSDSITKIKNSSEKFSLNIYDDPVLFPIRLLSEKIDSLFYQNKIISASNFSIIPLPHQVLTVNSVLEKFTPRVLIADEVGLGKTIEAALIYEELKLRKMVKRILIVAPSGLTIQWRDELKTKFNEDFVLINNQSFKSFQDVDGEENVWKSHDKIIVSIDFIKPQHLHDNLSEMEFERRLWHNNFITNSCINSEWDIVIFDEAHNLSKRGDGSETARYKFAKELSDISPILILLTATPHQGDSDKFRNLLKLIDPYKFYAPDSLNPDAVKSVTIRNNKRAATDFEGNRLFKKRLPQIIKISMDEEDIEFKLHQSVSNYVSEYYDIATRTKNFPIMFLLIIYQRMVSSSSKAIYKSLSKRLHFLKSDLGNSFKNKFENIDDLIDLNSQEIFDEITRLQQENINPHDITIDPIVEKEVKALEKCVSLAHRASSGRQDYKMRKLLEIIDEVILQEDNPDTKFLIFTEFIETQKYIQEVLENLGYSVTLFNGRMSLEEKIESKTKFKEESQFLISTDSGGEGINLQFCHVMINYDLPWNPMKIEQRIGRIDRIGQTKDVLVYNFVLEGTVEERVRSTLTDKLELIAQEFGVNKFQDVLSVISDETNFDEIYIRAITNQADEEELDRIAASIYEKAKEIIKKEDFLIPFTDSEDTKKIKSYIVDEESSLTENLIKIYANSKNVSVKEYSAKKEVYYFDDYVDGVKLKNIVFSREKSLENEQYEYLNFNHSFVRNIVLDSMEEDSLTFNLEYKGYSKDIAGTLFYYRFELTNNEGFVKRKIVPIFIDENGIFDSDVSFWFENLEEYNFKKSDEIIEQNFEDLLSSANTIRDEKMYDFKSLVELELLEKLNDEKDKFEKYFKDKEFAISKIAIENIRIKQFEKLRKERIDEMNKFSRKRNIVPKIELFAIANVRLLKDPEKLI